VGIEDDSGADSARLRASVYAGRRGRHACVNETTGDLNSTQTRRGAGREKDLHYGTGEGGGGIGYFGWDRPLS
jgi:hypothetical protein